MEERKCNFFLIFRAEVSEEKEGDTRAVTRYKIKALIIFTEDDILFIKRDMFNEKNSETILDLLQKENTDCITVYDLELETGKKHQIRAHLSSIMNTPVLFDYRYGFNSEEMNCSKLKEVTEKFVPRMQK